jgi:hypothetical protein
VGLVQPADEVDAASLEQQDVRPVGLQAIGQEDVPGPKDAPQRAQETDLALALAGVTADAQVEDRPARQ